MLILWKIRGFPERIPQIIDLLLMARVNSILLAMFQPVVFVFETTKVLPRKHGSVSALCSNITELEMVGKSENSILGNLVESVFPSGSSLSILSCMIAYISCIICSVVFFVARHCCGGRDVVEEVVKYFGCRAQTYSIRTQFSLTTGAQSYIQRCGYISLGDSGLKSAMTRRSSGRIARNGITQTHDRAWQRRKLGKPSALT